MGRSVIENKQNFILGRSGRNQAPVFGMSHYSSLMCFPDNEIQMTELVSFTESDIADLFKSFRDRMIVRQYIASKAVLSDVDSSAVEDNLSTDLSMTEDNDCRIKSQNSQNGCQFTAEQMLQKKGREVW